MGTVKYNDTTSEKSSQKHWTRASIAAALAAGAITTEAANILYNQLKQDPNEATGEQPEVTPEPVQSTTSDPEPTSTDTSVSNPQNSVNPNQPQESTHLHQPTSHPTPSQEPTPQPEPVIHPNIDPDPSPEPYVIPDPEPEPEPYPDPVIDPDPEPSPMPGERDDVVDVIVTEIDPHDIDMEDIFFVDDIGIIYTEDGSELNVAVINDGYGTTNLFVDVDGDNVYDLITTEEGDVIAQMPIDLDVSDMELLYAQQHGYDGYIEPNQFDIAMNEENNDIQNDISLT